MDRPPRESHEHEVRKRTGPASSGSLQYRHLDVQDVDQVERCMNEIASKHNRLDGFGAAAVEYIYIYCSLSFTGVKCVCRHNGAKPTKQLTEEDIAMSGC